MSTAGFVPPKEFRTADRRAGQTECLAYDVLDQVSAAQLPVYIYVYTYVYVYMYIMHVCMHVCMYICIYTHIHTRTEIMRVMLCDWRTKLSN